VSDRPEVRASDAERRAVVDHLTKHCSEGRLTLAEAEDRIAAAWAAKTVGELRVLLRDLPADRGRGGPPERVRPQRGRTALEVHVRVYLVVIGFLCLIWLLAGASYFWPIWPALGWGLALALHKAVD
jgi:hypothetical protein